MAKNEALSISQLEAMLQNRRNEIAELVRERSKVQEQINAIDEKIKSMGGGIPSQFGSVQITAAGRARNVKSLIKTMEEVLEKSTEPLTVGQILEGVYATGYRSNSSGFRAILNQTLIKERKRFVKVARGMYALKK
jgi:malate/lactate dehydrogenase